MKRPTFGRGTPSDDDPAVALLDEVLDDLQDFLPADLREQVRDLLLDAIAAHPVTRRLAERVRKQSKHSLN